MPYKNPEHKRQWEQEHREERNAKRRVERLAPGSGHATRASSTNKIAAPRTFRKPTSDPAPDQKTNSGWKEILGWAVGLGVVLLAAFAGLSSPDSSLPET